MVHRQWLHVGHASAARRSNSSRSLLHAVVSARLHASVAGLIKSRRQGLRSGHAYIAGQRILYVTPLGDTAACWKIRHGAMMVQGRIGHRVHKHMCDTKICIFMIRTSTATVQYTNYFGTRYSQCRMLNATAL